MKAKIGVPDWKKEYPCIAMELQGEYISDGLCDEHTSWNSKNPVLISAQTGAGKNYFIENSLLPWAIENGLDFTIFSNRLALDIQAKHRIAIICKVKKDLKLLSDEGLRQKHDFGQVKIFTYQAYQQFLQDHQKLMPLSKAQVVVFDEVHFFTADSTFNPTTGELLRNMIKRFQNSIRIYMTATEDEIFPVIAREEMKIQPQFTDFVNPADSYFHPKTLLLYTMKRNFQNYRFFYYKNFEVVCSFLSQKENTEKSILFVSTKKIGKKAMELLGDDAVFTTAESKKSESQAKIILEEIASAEIFSSRFLVSTKVLENGLNIKDKAVKNILIDCFDKTTFLQMLGRKRLEKGEVVNVFIPLKTEGDIELMLRGIRLRKKYLKEFKFDQKGLIDRIWKCSEEHKLVMNLISCYNGRFKTNFLAEESLENQEVFLNEILQKIKNGDEFASIKETLSWVGQRKNFNLKNFIDDETDNVLTVFLEKNLKKPMNNVEFRQFAIDFKEFVYELHGPQKNDRTDREYGVTKIRKILNKYGYNYGLSDSGGVKILFKK